MPAFRRHPYPLKLTFERLLTLVLAPLFLRQTLAFLLKPRGVITLVRNAFAAVEFEYPAGNIVQEITVVRNGDDRSFVFLQVLFKPAHGFGIQVVCRLVEQQNVGLLQQQSA